MILFVTGTDTGVGKTVTCAALGAHARAEGARVRYVKPVQTGLAAGDAGGDADFVAATAGIEAAELTRFADPLAPAVAAAREDGTIDVDSLVARTCEIAATCDVLLVEGAGGLLVPLTEEATMADLACALDADLVVVARPGLGTINHVALTLEAAARRDLRVARLVLSGWPADPGVAERTNLERLRHAAPRVDVLPHVDGLSVEDGVARALPAPIPAGSVMAAVV